MLKKDEKQITKFRYNLVTILIYICGIVLLCQLFFLQIVNGEEYRETSNTRLSRETTLKAARGNIYDRTGNIIAGTKMGFNLDLYKTKIDDKSLNTAILNMINVLEKNGDTYVDNLPITIEPFAYTFSTEEGIQEFLEENELKEGSTAEEAFNQLKEKYEIETENLAEARKIMTIRYEISENGYSVTKPITVATDISRASVNEFSERNASFAGINISTEAVRGYVRGSLASHVVGYIGKIDEDDLKEREGQGYNMNDYIGRLGIEYMFEEYLRGKDGVKQVDMTVDGTSSGEYISQEAIAGSDVVLTIDANLQEAAEQQLEENIMKIRNGELGTAYYAKSGAVVVMNVQTGEILALASYPDFEPQLFIKGISTEKWNEYNQEEVKALFNRAVQGSYAPGSIFKMATAIAALESGVIDTEERVLDRGIYPEGNRPHCWIYDDYGTTHGWVNVEDAIKHSCNYYFYEVGKRMGIDNLDKYASYFGLGKKTGIELMGETSGTLASKEVHKEATGEEWYLGQTFNAAIGQGYNDFSPLQMAKYISMLTNGGKQIKPTLIKTIINPDGTEVPREEIESFANQKTGYVEESTEDIQIHQEYLDAILEGMRSVTEETGGTAYSRFRDFEIPVGGKTGSTEAGDNINAWFAGFAPYDNPEIAVVVMVENGGHGNYTAEVVREIIREYFGINAGNVTEDTNSKPYTEEIR